MAVSVDTVVRLQLKTKEGVDFYQIDALNNTGHLNCKSSFCRTTAANKDQVYFCEHVQKLIEQFGDVKAIWKDGDPIVNVLQVPLMPSMNIWVPVFLDGERLPGGGVGLHLSLDYDTNERVEKIGNLFPGEGRFIIREMIWQWFFANQNRSISGELTDSKCESAAHSFTQEQTYKKNMNSPRRYGELWMLEFTKRCWSCNQGFEDFYDLVPKA